MQATSKAMNEKIDEHQQNLHSLCSKYRRVVACIDAFQDSRKVVPYGVIVANAFDAELTLMHVIERNTQTGTPSDPIASKLLRREASMKMEKLAKNWTNDVSDIHTAVLEGHPGDQICIWAKDHQVDLTVICTRQDRAVCDWDVGDTARRVMDCVTGSVLLIPESISESDANCRRILAPLDGSSRAESALQVALRLAETQDAELVLVHAVPEPFFTDIGPLEPEDVELRRRILQRNELAGRKYLSRIRDRISGSSIPVRTVVLSGGDPRHLIARSILDERADMVVVSSHGFSGHLDMAAGSVASHLMTHTSIPLFIVRSELGAPTHRMGAANGASGLRLPMREVA